MNSEDKIFEPLTFKQFLYVGSGALISYFAFENLDLKLSIPIIILVAGVCVAIYLNSPKIVFDEHYIKMKRSNSKNPEEFSKWLNIRYAELQSQISMRKERGLVADPEFESAMNLIKDAMENKL